MPDAAAWLLDTNILLRMSKSDDPHHPMIRDALHALVAQGARLCFTSQTLGEFWNASTRQRDQNGFGLSTAETDRIARVIERDFEFLPDSRDVHDRWRQLLVAHEVKGVQVHDARLAASMYVHGVTQLLTVNVRDFRRFTGLRPRWSAPHHSLDSSVPHNRTMLIVHVHVHVKPEHVEAFRQATIENASHSVQEPGIARFDVMQQDDDPTRFVLTEVYRDAAAPAQHRTTAHYQAWAEKVAGMMAEPRSRVIYSNVFPADPDW